MKLDILKPSVFDKYEIVAGVTQSNYDKFEKGFSIFPGNILTQEEVSEFRNLLANEINIPIENHKYQKQVHGSTVRIVNAESSNTAETDGMITNIPGLVLNVTLADCGGVLIFDPVKKAIAALHSGWKGTKLNIVAAGVEMMINEYGSNPIDLIAYLSPCASVANYEIGDEVAVQFPEHVVEKRDGKLYLDIKKQIKMQMIELGILEDNIEISPICTIVDKNYHSYRRDRDNSGRMSAYIAIK